MEDSIKFTQLEELVSKDKIVLLETSAISNYLNGYHEPENIEEKIEYSRSRIDFYRFLSRNLPQLSNWYVIPSTIDELRGNKQYNYKKVVKKSMSYCHRYNIKITSDRRECLKYRRKIRKENQETRKLIDSLEKENRILYLNQSQQKLAESLDSYYTPLKKEIGVEALSDCDWNFMIAGLAVAKETRHNVSLISNDFVMIPFWKHILRKEYLTHENFKFFIRTDFKKFKQLKYRF